jgi:RNA polymerase sigma factor (sigma-70 family)
MSRDADPSSINEVSDHALLARIRQGDSVAEELLFDRYYDRLVEYARRKMSLQLRRMDSPSELAHSAMKSVFVKIPNGQYDVADGMSLWPLLTTIAIHKIINRSKKRRIGSLPGGELPSPAAGPDEQASVNDLLDRLEQELGPRRWQILKLFFEGWRIGEIAEKTGVSERTVYTTRKTAEEILRQLADECQPDAREC